MDMEDIYDFEEGKVYYIISEGDYMGVFLVTEIRNSVPGMEIIKVDQFGDSEVELIFEDEMKPGEDKEYFSEAMEVSNIHANKGDIQKELKILLKSIFNLQHRLSEGLDYDMGNQIDTPTDVTRKNKFTKLINAIKDNDTLKMTYIVNAFPRLEIGATLDKLKKRKTKYSKYPGYDVAIAKLEWRRSH